MTRKFTDKEIAEGCRVVINDEYPGQGVGSHGKIVSYEQDMHYPYRIRVDDDDGLGKWMLARELDKEEE